MFTIPYLIFNPWNANHESESASESKTSDDNITREGILRHCRIEMKWSDNTCLIKLSGAVEFAEQNKTNVNLHHVCMNPTKPPQQSLIHIDWNSKHKPCFTMCLARDVNFPEWMFLRRYDLGTWSDWLDRERNCQLLERENNTNQLYTNNVQVSINDVLWYCCLININLFKADWCGAPSGTYLLGMTL